MLIPFTFKNSPNNSIKHKYLKKNKKKESEMIYLEFYSLYALEMLSYNTVPHPIIQYWFIKEQKNIVFGGISDASVCVSFMKTSISGAKILL